MMPSNDEPHGGGEAGDDVLENIHPPLPPPYIHTNAHSHPTCSIGSSPIPSGDKPCNRFLISRVNESIRGTYTVDPCLAVPTALLTTPGNGAKREPDKWNLKLETTKGDIDVIVHVLDGGGGGGSVDTKRRTQMMMHSLKGSVTVRIIPVEESNDGLVKGGKRRGFIVSAATEKGSVNVLLPRSFAGAITAFAGLGSSPRGPVELSPDLQRNSRMLMDTEFKKYVVGDDVPVDDETLGDFDFVSVGVGKGRVNVGYHDEVQVEMKTARWKKILCF